MRKMFISKLLSKDSKKKLNIAYLRPIVMYGCETWSMTQGDLNKLLTIIVTKLLSFKRKILREIYGFILNPNTGVLMRAKKKLCLKNSLFNATNCKDFLRSKRLEWPVVHVWRAEGGWTDNKTCTH